MTEQLWQSLTCGLEEMELSVPDDQQQQLIDYVLLLARWNKVHNLTAVKSPEQMITRHVLDSLSIVRFLQGKTLLDIGAGAGLPGIPIAVTHPELAVTLVDCVSKKTRFMTIAASTLGLRNVQVNHSRVESLDSEFRTDMVTARAFAETDVLCQLARPFLKPGGLVLAMTGRSPNHEQMERLQQIDAYKPPQIHKLSVPGEQGERNLVILKRCEDR